MITLSLREPTIFTFDADNYLKEWDTLTYSVENDYGQIATSTSYQIFECGMDRFLYSDLSALAMQIKDWGSEKHYLVWEETHHKTAYTTNKIKVSIL